jgi:TetR/AcrR family transcriptional repressor of nem operon
MSRPIEFDRPQAVNRALVLFWQKGYQATSLTDLLETMGIGRSSFYAAFTDKRIFYIECLDLFADRTLHLLQAAPSEMPPVEALEHFFKQNFLGLKEIGVKKNWGCMLVNTVLEMAGVDDELSERASHHLNTMELGFKNLLKEAAASPQQAQELAAMLMLFNEGIRVSSRRRLTDAQHLQTIDTTFRLIRSALA